MAAILVLAATSLRAPAQMPYERFHQTHAAMGTEFTIDLYAQDQAVAGQMTDLAFEEVDRLEALLSNYQPSSELSRISREAAQSPITTDPETFHFLERSRFWSERTNGAFDITVGPLLRAWGFFFHQGRIPPPLELATLHQKIGWQHIVLTPSTRTVAFTDGQPLDLDPGSIGKGFTVDRIASLLRQEGVTAALISAGGSTLYAIGAPPGYPGWPINIPDPRHAGTVASTIFLRDTSVSTGACTQKFFIQDGHRYCHIFDPRTMRPVEDMLQTTVIDPSATDSDALSTAVFVLSSQDSRQLITSLPGSSALIFDQPVSRNAASSCLAINWPSNPCDRSSAHAPEEPTHD